MNPALNSYLASELISDRVKAAERFRRARQQRAQHEPDPHECVTVRRYRPKDAAALRRISQLEGRPLPAEPMLVAEVDGQLLAARSLARRETVADPFHHTAGLIELLDLRSAHLREEPSDGRVRARRVRRFVRVLTAPIR
jgi:hypothetical protein